MLLLQGFRLRLSVMPFSYWSMSDYNPASRDRRKMFMNHAGSKRGHISIYHNSDP